MKPLSDRINALPKWARQYIMYLHTRADPQGDIAEIFSLREQRAELLRKLKEAERENRRLQIGLAKTRRK